jgi:dihydroflavonol-4-reductase/farnesol dehydrogenase
MKILITGSTGYLGNKLAHILAGKGYEIHALVRPGESDILLQHPRMKIFYGDLLDFNSIRAAMEGCQQVYHTAGLVRLWARDPSEFYLNNVNGTENVLAAALSTGVKKMVYTSTCGVWASSMNNPLTETDPRTAAFDNDYDLSKCLAEKLVKEYSYKGLFTVIVNPSRVYGPGIYRHSNGVNRFLLHLLRNKIAFVPANLDTEANYAFIDDVVNGHLLAMEHGLGGERYILGGENASYKRIIGFIKKSTSSKNIFLRLPETFLTAFSWIELMRGKINGHDPLIIPKIVKRFSLAKTFDCSKAIRQLGYTITPLEVGLQITLDHFKKL